MCRIRSVWVLQLFAYPFGWGRIDPLRGFGHFVDVIYRETAYFHSLATSRFKKTLPLAARAPGVHVASSPHICAPKWDSWIRWRCAVDGAGRRARRRNDLISSPFDRASRVVRAVRCSLLDMSGWRWKRPHRKLCRWISNSLYKLISSQVTLQQYTILLWNMHAISVCHGETRKDDEQERAYCDCNTFREENNPCLELAHLENVFVS